MESGDCFDFMNFLSPPIDEEGLPFAPPASSPPPPPLLPNHTNGDLPQSAAAVDLQGWELPAFSSTPTDEGLVENHLAPAIDRLKLSNGGSRSSPSRPSVVNTGLPLMNPREIPGMSFREGLREKYYLTDLHDLCFTSAPSRNTTILKAPDGFWKQRDCGSAFIAGNETCSGLNAFGHFKKTFHFHATWGGPSGLGVDTRTIWTMNVYALINEDAFIEDEMVLCHVFEDYSYVASPGCVMTSRNYSARRYTPLNAQSISALSLPPSTYASYLADLENTLLGEPDTSTDTDNYDPRRDVPPIAGDGQSRKRKKNRSDVWDYFTKIYARDCNGEVLTFAACNHCFKLMTGASGNGTAHLARHRCSCPCKLQPVAAGRNAQAAVNVLSS